LIAKAWAGSAAKTLNTFRRSFVPTKRVGIKRMTPERARSLVGGSSVMLRHI
jgi:hypothetical protein